MRLTCKLLLDCSVTQRRQAGDELLVVNLIVSRLVEHAEKAVQDLRVRFHCPNQLQGLSAGHGDTNGRSVS